MAKILLISPHSVIEDYSQPESLLAISLVKAGHSVVRVHCAGYMNRFCVGMSAMKLNQESTQDERDKVCRICTIRRDVQNRYFGLRSIQLDSYLNQDAKSRVEDILRDPNLKENYWQLEHFGVSVGRSALYEFLLQHKKMEIHFTEIEWERYRIALRNALLTLEGAKQILATEKPDCVIAFNSLYSANAAFCQLAKNAKIEQYFLHPGTNLSESTHTLMVGKDFTWRLLKDLIRDWEDLKDQPCSPEEIRRVMNHVLVLTHAKNALVYSQGRSSEPKSIKKHFGVRSSQKLLVATMSSYDERLAVESVGAFSAEPKLLFKKQIDWIRALLLWIKDRPDLFLIIRVHPREFPNKRDSVLSEHAKDLQKEFQSLPENVKVNWPEDLISLYDMTEEVDVFLNAWSSVGKEMALLGIPVVIYSPELILYPKDLNEWGITEATYFSAIERALKSGRTYDRVQKAFRWYALEFQKSVIDLGVSKGRPNTLLRIALRLVKALSPDLFVRAQEWLILHYLDKNIKDDQAIQRLFDGYFDHPWQVKAAEYSPVSAETEKAAIYLELKRLPLGLARIDQE